MKKVYAEIDRQ